MLSIIRLDLFALILFLPGSCFFASLKFDVGTLPASVTVSSTPCMLYERTSTVLFGANNLPLNILIVIGPPACRTQPIHIILDIVVTKLADLERILSALISGCVLSDCCSCPK